MNTFFCLAVNHIRMKQDQIFESGKIITHFTGAFSSDVALCGEDLAGNSFDYEGQGYYYSSKSSKEVDCKDCLKVISLCKRIDS